MTPLERCTSVRSGLGLGELAAGLGYGSEAAFHRAFKGINGVTPEEIRRQRRERLQRPAETLPSF